MSGSRDMSAPTKVAGFVEDVPYSAGEMETQCRFTSVGHCGIIWDNVGPFKICMRHYWE